MRERWLTAPQDSGSAFQHQLSPIFPDNLLLGVSYNSNINSPVTESDSGSASAASTSGPQIPRRMSRQPSLPNPNLWDSAKQKRFETRVARLTASAGLPLAWVDNIEFIDLIAEFIPGAKPPSRKVLTNRLIPTTVDELRAEAKSAASGHEATIQADGWTGQNKHHLIAVMITVHGEVHFFRGFCYIIIQLTMHLYIGPHSPCPRCLT